MAVNNVSYFYIFSHSASSESVFGADLTHMANGKTLLKEYGGGANDAPD